MAPPDKNAFVGIVDTHRRLILKVCNSYCREVEKRKDLAQEIILQLWKAYPRYDARYKLSTWMYRIALNVAISFYRKEKKYQSTESLSRQTLDLPEETTINDIEANLKQMHQFIDGLDELNKALMILYLDNNSYKDIADVLGITETNVATKISRIKQKIREHFASTENQHKL